METQKAGCFLVNEKTHEIALIYRDKITDWSFPKGHLEKGETLRECAIRETAEETKRDCKIVCEHDFIDQYTTSSGEKCVCHMYIAFDKGHSDNQSTDTHETKWFPIEEVEDVLSYEFLKKRWRVAKLKILQLLNKEKRYFVLASNNLHKIKEFREILKDCNVLSIKDVGYEEDIEENGTTFLENSLIKANSLHNFLQQNEIEATVLADDSGLCVDALGGLPGIYSARFAGEHGDSHANRQKLLSELSDKSNRDAHFVCVIVKMEADSSYVFSEGKTFGKILTEEIGDTSFGYDCLFWSNELKKSFGEATNDEKNSVSHRSRAIHNLLER